MKRLGAPLTKRLCVETPLFVDDGNIASVRVLHRLLRGEHQLALPFVLVGPADSGKSRWLAEAHNAFVARGRSVEGGTVAEWTQRLRVALERREMLTWAASLAEVDLLWIDEIHRVATAPKTAEFLFGRVAERMQRNLPTLVASRQEPAAIHGLEPRHRSLLLGGFLLCVARPGESVRRRFATQIARGTLTPERIEQICQATAGGLGALRRALEGGAVEPASGGGPRMGLDALLTAAAAAFDVDAAAVAGRVRTFSVARAREAFVVLALEGRHDIGAIRRKLDGRGALAVSRIAARGERRRAEEPSFAALLGRLAAGGASGPP